MTLLKRKYDPRSREMHEVGRFTELPRFFDEIFTSNNYQKNAMYFMRLAQQKHINLKAITELGCRSGGLLHFFAERSIDINGVELTQEMVDWAHGYAQYKSIPGNFFLADIKTKIPVDGQDMVLCLHQNVNYLRTFDELKSFFSNVRLTIHPEGIFLFEIMTEKCASELFHEYLDYDLINPGYYVHKAYYVEDKRILHQMFELYPHETDIMYVENHYLYIWEIDAIKELVEEHGFKVINMLESGKFHEYDDETNYVLFVCSPT